MDYTKVIQEACTRVYSELGPGLSESIYQNALGVEFQMAGLGYDMEVTMPVMYRGRAVGFVRADIIVYLPPEAVEGGVESAKRRIIIETKATTAAIKPEERNQLTRYLQILSLTTGVIVNFRSNLKNSEIEFEVIENTP